MTLIPTRLVSEDAADISIREYLCRIKGWDVAFYSPPCGSWSTIKIHIDDFLYETFSPRDVERPDIVLYKIVDNKLHLLTIESKDSVGLFTRNAVTKYIDSMKVYGENLLREKYRLVKNVRSGQFFENMKLPDTYAKNYDLKIGLLACSNSIESDIPFLESLLPSSRDIFGLLVQVDWSRPACKIQSIRDCSGQFSDNKLIEFVY